MKLSQMAAKMAIGNKRMLSVLGGLVIAGVASLAVVPAASAQVSFGVSIGGPRYYAPAPRAVYVAPGYGYSGYGYSGYGYAPAWDHRRAEEWRAREYGEQQFYDRRSWDRGNHWRGDDRRDDGRVWR